MSASALRIPESYHVSKLHASDGAGDGCGAVTRTENGVLVKLRFGGVHEEWAKSLFVMLDQIVDPRPLGFQDLPIFDTEPWVNAGMAWLLRKAAGVSGGTVPNREQKRNFINYLGRSFISHDPFHVLIAKLMAARFHCEMGEWEEARKYVDIAMSLSIQDLYSQRLHLLLEPDGAAQAQAGKAYLEDRYCPEPFTHLETAPESGLINLCCGTLLPPSVGSVFDEPRAAFNSPSAFELRRSVLDGSFAYCSKLHCHKIRNKTLPPRYLSALHTNPHGARRSPPAFVEAFAGAHVFFDDIHYVALRKEDAPADASNLQALLDNPQLTLARSPYLEHVERVLAARFLPPEELREWGHPPKLVASADASSAGYLLVFYQGRYYGIPLHADETPDSLDLTRWWKWRDRQGLLYHEDLHQLRRVIAAIRAPQRAEDEDAHEPLLIKSHHFGYHIILAKAQYYAVPIVEAIGAEPEETWLAAMSLTDLEALVRSRSPYYVEAPVSLHFLHDRSCQISCPQCRVHVYIAKGVEKQRLESAVPGLLNLLRGARRLVLSGGGDPFASYHYRSIIKATAAPEYQDLRVDLLTNGLLINERTWAELKLRGRAHHMLLSIDASRPQTFEKLRRGSSWDDLLRSLAFVSRLRETGELRELKSVFAVQRDNFREMVEFVELVHKYRFDGVAFQRILNWGTYPDQFADIDIFRDTHPDHQELLRVMEHDIFGSPFVELRNLQEYREAALKAKAARQSAMAMGRVGSLLRGLIPRWPLRPRDHA